MPPLRGSYGCFRFPWVPRTLCAAPTAVLCHRDAVLWYATATRFCVLPPRRGCRGLHPRLCYATATRFPWVDTHGCVMPPLRGSRGLTPTVVVCHPYGVPYFFPAFRGFRARCALHPRSPWVDTHGCVMPPLRGSCVCFRFPWVPRTLCASPTAVLCHRYAVLCSATATRFCGMSPLRGSYGCFRYSQYYTPTIE